MINIFFSCQIDSNFFKGKKHLNLINGDVFHKIINEKDRSHKKIILKVKISIKKSNNIYNRKLNSN